MYDKPFKTYNQQLDNLEDNHGLTIPDRLIAEHYISTTSYYTLINGYKECFSTDSKFDEKILIDHLFLFHHFDVGLQNILFKYGLYAENFFKTKLAYTLSKNMGVHQNEYLDFKMYNSRSRSIILRETIDNLNRVHQTDNPEDPTKHYKTKNHIPAWILFRNANFNDVINLYSFLQADDKAEVAESLLPFLDVEVVVKKELVKNCLTLIRKFRNKIAHRLKFTSYRVSYLNALPLSTTNYFPDTILSKDDFKAGIGQNNIYAFIISLLLMIDDNYLRNQLILELKNHITLFTAYDEHKILYDKYIEVTNLPLNFEIRLDYIFSFYNNSNEG